MDGSLRVGEFLTIEAHGVRNHDNDDNDDNDDDDDDDSVYKDASMVAHEYRLLLSYSHSPK